MNIDQLAFAESFSGLGAISSWLSSSTTRQSWFKDYMKSQQSWADKNHKGNLKNQVIAGFKYESDPKAPARQKGSAYIYYKSTGFNADKVMMDLKELRPDLFKPEYLPSAATPAKINSPAVPAVAAGGGSFMENIKGYATPKNIAIAAAGAGLIYWFVIRK
ncbi:hypothetical protein [Catalinimonas niigatensis]|uniref:hypothetical protein n=1 Tax=Catalinimonas niigatensis TaxID=1397264 RepID=UPI002665A827|nr:hypothetical protein [Catalinimonas niigatensis]WPP48960.1 hypothetical protein PZB72_20035 [Catalinimonas niigatensis]